jgi:hypothetical protein
MKTYPFIRTVILTNDTEEVEVQEACRALYDEGKDGTPRSITFELNDARQGKPANWQPMRISRAEQDAVITWIESEYDAEQRRMVEQFDEETV